ncbi:uncharacterized protein LOC131953311 [Physella acuta]|uniref:uncharacterized protein LOC131953311 n=1 Tax=Physella acuta TaxID=109671 RepID=UPI0027DAD9B6|nr:uncharacterized protein LOC131953311 [Physella acuta]
MSYIPSGLPGSPLRNGAIENTFTCLHNLYIQCAKSKEGIQHLELNINFNHWQRSIHELCDNILFLKTNARCEDQAQKEYVGCLMDVITNSFHETEALKRELESSYHLSKSQRTEALLASLCSVTLKTIDCVRGPYQRYCPVKMKNLIVRTIEGFMHPKCAMLNQPQVPDYDSSEEVVVPVSKSHEIQVVLDSKSQETGYDVNSGDQDQRHGVPLMQDEVIETPKEKPLGQKASKLTDGKNGVQGRQASWVGSWLFPLVLLGLILL